MGLNIKNERVHALAKRASTLSGKTQTGAIEAALEEYLRALGEDPREREVQRKVDVAREIALAWAPRRERFEGAREIDDLYDDVTGLPR